MAGILAKVRDIYYELKHVYKHETTSISYIIHACKIILIIIVMKARRDDTPASHIKNHFLQHH